MCLHCGRCCCHDLDALLSGITSGKGKGKKGGGGGGAGGGAAGGIDHVLSHNKISGHHLFATPGRDGLVVCIQCLDMFTEETEEADALRAENEKCQELIERLTKKGKDGGMEGLLSTVLSYQVGPTLDTSADPVTIVSQALEVANAKVGVVKGLFNLGNTCFFNSVVQVLVRTPALMRTVLGHFKVNSLLPYNRGLAVTLLNLRLSPASGQGDAPALAAVPHADAGANKENAKKDAVVPSALFGVVCISNPRFARRAQQDAHELLYNILEGLDSEWTRFTKKNKVSGPPELPSQAFSGSVESVVTCLRCGTPSQTKEQFSCLSVEIGPFFSTEDPREADQPGQQEQEQQHGDAENEDAEQQLQLEALFRRPTLEATVKELERAGVKEVRAIAADLRDSLRGRNGSTLLSCLEHYTSPELIQDYHCSVCRAASESLVHQQGSKQILILTPPEVLVIQLKRFRHTITGDFEKVDKKVSFDVNLDLAPFSRGGVGGVGGAGWKYRLYGVVEHAGTLERGHYVSYAEIRDGKSGWFWASDSVVTITKVEDVVDSQAYLLFYERVDAL